MNQFNLRAAFPPGVFGVGPVDVTQGYTDRLGTFTPGTPYTLSGWGGTPANEPAASTVPVASTSPAASITAAMPVAAMPRAPAGAPSYADLRNQVAKMYTGLLNRQDAGYTADPLATGLLNMGAALSQYGAPSTTPKGGFMGAIGAGGQGFIGGYQAAADARRKAEMALLDNKLAAAKALMDAQKDEAGQIVGSAETGFYRVGLDGAVTPVVAGVGRKPGSLEQNLVAAGYTPGTPEYADAARKYLEKQSTVLNIPAGYQPAPGGGLEPTPGGPADQYSQNQADSAGFADRVLDAMKVMDDPAVLKASTDVFEKFKYDVPKVGDLLASSEYLQFDQARRNFINAVLRRESGAAISEAEFDNAYQQYLPTPNNPPEVLEQKRQNRERALAALIRSAGPKYARDKKNERERIGDMSDEELLKIARGEK